MSFELQNKIRQNAIEMREVVSDLYQWEQEMELKEKMRGKLKKEEREKAQEVSKTEKQNEIRQAKEKQEELKKKVEIGETTQEVKKDLVRDANTIRDYYKAWDKFDVDKELTKLQEEELRAYRPYNPYEDSKNNLRAKPKTKINVKGRRNIISDPTDLKDRGNLHFQSLQYDKAINCYTDCLKKLDQENIPYEKMTEQRKKLRCIVLSNRAMSYLKVQQTIKALNDATQSLVYNPNYSKSYYRRAECLKKLGKFRESLKDFRMVRSLEPTQTKADAEIKKIEAFLAKRAKQTRESMLLEYNPNLMIGSKRIEIEQVSQFSEETKDQKKTNYLQEL